MTQFDIQLLASQLQNVQHEVNMGYSFYFVGSDHYLPFVTIGYADNEGDAVSNLNREGVFRVNIGVKPETFKSMFPHFKSVDEYDYTALDTFMPHPHYASYGYICILNPSQTHEEQVKQYILEAYAIATKREAAKQR